MPRWIVQLRESWRPSRFNRAWLGRLLFLQHLDQTVAPVGQTQTKIAREFVARHHGAGSPLVPFLELHELLWKGTLGFSLTSARPATIFFAAVLHRHRHHRFKDPIIARPAVSFPGTAQKQSPPLHPLERSLLAVVALHLVFLPWALGTMHVWSQCVSFGLSAVSLALAVRPRNFTGEYTDEAPHRLHPLRKLLRFPIFWLGLLLLLYILIQALNPAWEYVTNGTFWWMQGIPCIDWLPTGMRTPFSQASPWRSMMIYSSAWMTVCAVWIGFTRRRTLQILLVSTAVNGALLALLGLAQRATGATEILGFWKPSNPDFAATFINHNHGAAYFNLMLAVSSALAFWHYRRQLRRGEDSSPALLFGFFALVIALLVAFSDSRTGGFLMIAFMLLAVGVVGRRMLFSSESAHSPGAAIVIGLALALFVGHGIYTLKTGGIVDRLRGVGKDSMAGEDYPRWVAAGATWEMAQDELIDGWGAGSYRFHFPAYQARHPEILVDPDTHIRVFWEHAHDDYLELLAELGSFGCGLLVISAVFVVIRVANSRISRHAPATLLLMGLVGTALHATVDFPFFCPAILITWCALWPVLLKWAELDLKLEQRA